MSLLIRVNPTKFVPTLTRRIILSGSLTDPTIPFHRTRLWAKHLITFIVY